MPDARAVPAPDPARSREYVAELERAREVQARVVSRLDDLLDDERRELVNVTRRLDEVRQHPVVVAALAQTSEQAVGHRERHPGDPWLWLESIAGGSVLPAVGRGVTMELARDDVSGRVYVAPAGTLPPAGERWTLARVVTS
jgi:hypothetical protein